MTRRGRSRSSPFRTFSSPHDERGGTVVAQGGSSGWVGSGGVVLGLVGGEWVGGWVGRWVGEYQPQDRFWAL